MIKISTEANPNYLAKVVEIKDSDWKEHPNADKLKLVTIDFQTIVTGKDAPEGVYIYFPVESALNVDFLSQTNSFREKELNVDKEQAGFFEHHGRVKALRLRSIPSSGYIVPVKIVEDFAGMTGLSSHVGVEFDTINDILLVKKYQVKTKESGLSNKSGKKPKVSRLIEGQVHLHIDTANLRKEVFRINPNDLISVTDKVHGTSWWVSNVLVKKSLTLKQKIAKWFGVNVVEIGYDFVYGSRKVVKNSELEDPKAKDHFYGYDIWESIKDIVKDFIPKGYTLYGECFGFDKNGGTIQKGFDYGCQPNEFKLEVYRITNTTPDGLVTELNYPQIKEFCDKVGLSAPVLFYSGKAKDLYTEINLDEHWNENFLRNLERDFNEQDDPRCVNKVPAEGIVVRKESFFDCESFKLKSFRFLEWETKQLDAGESDLESDN